MSLFGNILLARAKEDDTFKSTDVPGVNIPDGYIPDANDKIEL